MYAPPLKSCLFANTSSRASFISLSWMILVSSVLASSIRARSFESMTKISPWVPVTAYQHGFGRGEYGIGAIKAGRHMRAC